MFAPFAGLLFDPDRVTPLAAATSPPYDVITEEQRVAYEAASPYSVVRVLLAAPGDERYQSAAATLDGWRRAGILVSDPEPRFYLYTMTYRDPDGEERVAGGVLGALDVVPPGERILAHEETMAHARADRMAALSATRANADVIIGLSPAPGLGDLLAPTGPPRIDIDVEGVRHRLYDVTDPGRIGAIVRAVDAHPVSIADGHHRYTTALAYATERRRTGGGGPWDAILCFLSPVDGGLTVGAIHRVFADLPAALDSAALAGAFEVSPGPVAAPERPGDLVVVSGDGDALHLRPRPDALEPLPGPWREAGTAVAREVLYPLLGIGEAGATYANSLPDALAALAHHPAGLAVLTSPVSTRAIGEAAAMGLRFPQKTTFFVPKPRAGLVIRTLDRPA